MEHLPEVIEAVVPALLAVIGFLVELATTVLGNTEGIDSFIRILVAFIPVVESMSDVTVAFIPILEALLPIFIALLPLIEIGAIILAILAEVLAAILVPILQLFVSDLERIRPVILIVARSIEFMLSPLEKLANLLGDVTVEGGSAADTLKTVGDAAKGLSDFVGGGAGKITGLIGFQEGGTVPGPIGEPTFGIIHGGETIRTPEQEAALNNAPNIVMNDTINVSINIEWPWDDITLAKISKGLAKTIVDDKRNNIKNLLLEEW